MRAIVDRLACITIPFGFVLLDAAMAGAFSSVQPEPAVRLATEPSTGSMVVAALVVIAAVRRSKTQTV